MVSLLLKSVNISLALSFLWKQLSLHTLNKKEIKRCAGLEFGQPQPESELGFAFISLSFITLGAFRRRVNSPIFPAPIQKNSKLKIRQVNICLATKQATAEPKPGRNFIKAKAKCLQKEEKAMKTALNVSGVLGRKP